MDDIQLITITLAMYGAFLSTILALYKFYENKRRLKINVAKAHISIDDSEPKEYFIFSCTNIGKRPLTIMSYGILLPNKSTLFFTNDLCDRIPKILNDGDMCKQYANITNLTKTLKKEGYNNEVKLRGFFEDSTYQKYYSKKFNINPKKIKRRRGRK